jgi:myo-inositol-1(or 4)-monophosphatase
MLKTAISAAKKAGVLIKTDFSREKELSYKKDNSILTQTDINAHNIIVACIQEKFPNHAILSEEGRIDKPSDYLWVIDPLDGTTNFSHSIPYFCVSVGLLHKYEPVLGVVYQPLTNELFTAQKGLGAHLNEERFSINPLSQSASRTVLSLDRARTKDAKIRQAKLIFSLYSRDIGATIRSMGSNLLSLVYLADSRFHAHITIAAYMHDYMPASIIAKEAGIIVTDFQGKALTYKNTHQDVVAAHPAIHKQLLPFLKISHEH